MPGWLVAQAEAELDRAIRRVKSLMANDGNLGAQVSGARSGRAARRGAAGRRQADFERAQIDLQRREALVDSGSVSGDELTRARNAYAAAAGAAGRRQGRGGAGRRQPALGRRRQAGQRRADQRHHAGHQPRGDAGRARAWTRPRLDLARTVIRAPVDGVVAKRQVQLGQRVQPGMPLMAVVPVARHLRRRQLQGSAAARRCASASRSTLHADLYGKDVTYHGVVEGFSGGSGSAFSAIPAQNATGNWIKVVQRLPVRVKLDPAGTAGASAARSACR